MIFLDTGFIFALADVADENHHRVRGPRGRRTRTGRRLSDFVIKHGEGLADDHDEAFEEGARDELLSALAAEAAEEEGD